MTEVVVTFVFEHTIVDVWRFVRDFNSLPRWLPVVCKSEIENALAADQIGAIRRLHLRPGGPAVRERLLALSDLHHSCTYSLLEGPLAARDLVAEMQLWEVTATRGTFGRWRAEFDALDQDRLGVTKQLKDLFLDGWTSLERVLSDQRRERGR